MLFLTAWEKVNGLKRERERERGCVKRSVCQEERERPNKGRISHYEFFVLSSITKKIGVF